MISPHTHQRVCRGTRLEACHASAEVNSGAKSSTGMPFVVATTTSGVVAVPVTVTGIGWDAEVREVAARHGVVYQGFSLLTANRPLVEHPDFVELANELDAAPEQLVFRFAQRVGMLPLTGTTDSGHMRLDLASEQLDLPPELVVLIESVAG